MEILEMMVIILQITTIFAKRKHKNPERRSSDDSIENLLYFKDCKQKHTTSAPQKLDRIVEPPKPPACPCPRMCCSMCCDCGVPEGPQSFVSRQMSPLQMASLPSLPSFNEPPKMNMPGQQPMLNDLPDLDGLPAMVDQPQILRRGVKRKKMKMMFQQPKKPGEMGPSGPPSITRRLGFTRENIKTLISKDQDIKKILKDLVRVTMHKVDLDEAVKSRRSMIETTVEPEENSVTPLLDDEDLIDEIE